MTDSERNTYSKLFDITEQNLLDAGCDKMPTFKETFMASLELDPAASDLSLAYGIPKDKFMQVLYYVAFRRWVAEDEVKERLSEEYSSDEEFKNLILKNVFECTERAIKKKVVFNYADLSDEGIQAVGRFKRKVRRTLTKIKAAIPLEQKMAVKKIFLKIINR